MKLFRGALMGIVLGLLSSASIFFFNGILANGTEAQPKNEFSTKLDDEMFGDSFVRFHVKANSDEDYDLELKYKVRDVVLEYIKDDLAMANNQGDAIMILEDKLDDIKIKALQTIIEEGYNYHVNVYITEEYFPMRQYGDMVVPAGDYKALRIDIGKAKGENFWCMLYPAVCYTKDSGAVISSQGKEELKEALTDEQYQELFVGTEAREEGRVKVESKIWNFLTDWW